MPDEDTSNDSLSQDDMDAASNRAASDGGDQADPPDRDAENSAFRPRGRS